MNKKLVDGLAKTAVDYGQASYQFQEANALVNRQKLTLKNLRKRESKPETRRVGAHALEMLREEIIQTRHRIWADTRHSKWLGREVARLRHTLENRTRQLVAAE